MLDESVYSLGQRGENIYFFFVSHEGKMWIYTAHCSIAIIEILLSILIN